MYGTSSKPRVNIDLDSTSCMTTHLDVLSEVGIRQHVVRDEELVVEQHVLEAADEARMSPVQLHPGCSVTPHVPRTCGHNAQFHA